MNRIEEFEKLTEDTGWGLIPLKGKKPFENNWQQWCEKKRSFSPNDYKNGINAGIPGGPANRVIFLDIDYLEKFKLMLKEKGWNIPTTRLHETGRGLPHFVYEYPKNGHEYGCTSVKDPDGEVDPVSGKVKTVFDIKGLGGQVVAPGSIHPETGKPYTVKQIAPIAPCPQWILDLVARDNGKGQKGAETGRDNAIEGLHVSYAVKRLIEEGEVKGKRSEAIMSVLNALTRASLNDQDIIQIFENYAIGEKYREKGRTREKWLLKQIDKCRQGSPTGPGRDVSSRVRQYLLEEFDGGVFRLGDIRRELAFTDRHYTLARQCVKRMVASGEIEKHGHQMGCYRVVDKKKNCIDWDATEAKASPLILPAGLHEVATIRQGDMVAFAGYKNHAKSAIAIETVRLNLDRFKVHFHITEYAARMKQRLIDFGVDLHHPNLFAYQVEKSDYIPDKIESGDGVLNVIDHLPNLDNFYLVGKTQDEIHRSLDGAICVITHQKKNADDLDAIGGSFWTITPTLAVAMFMDEQMAYPGRMMIRKGKEPGKGHTNITGLSLRYELAGGCKYRFAETGWTR